jgi:hypothetical protein
MRWLSADADNVNAVFQADVEARVVSIPDEWRAKPASDFLNVTMESLSDPGRKRGADPHSWGVWGAPGRAGGVPPRDADNHRD